MSPKQWTMRYGLLVGAASGALLLAACGGSGSGTATTQPTASSAPSSIATARATVTRAATTPASVAPSVAPVATAPPTTAAPSASPAPAGKQQKYVVKDGDTLSGIAAQFGVTVQQIIDANSLQNPDLIVQGQELIIPAP